MLIHDRRNRIGRSILAGGQLLVILPSVSAFAGFAAGECWLSVTPVKADGLALRAGNLLNPSVLIG